MEAIFFIVTCYFLNIVTLKKKYKLRQNEVYI